MSDTFWTSFFANSAAIITAVGVLVGIILSARNGAKLTAVKASTAVVIDGNEKIHTLVNSDRDRLKAEIARLEGIIDALQRGEPHP